MVRPAHHLFEPELRVDGLSEIEGQARERLKQINILTRAATALPIPVGSGVFSQIMGSDKTRRVSNTFASRGIKNFRLTT